MSDTRDLIELKSCTGCGCCKNICPVDAIEMEYDNLGYLKPVINFTKCINCNKCVKSCPVFNNLKCKENFELPSCYAFQADDTIRIKSSSGGFFTSLSKYVLSREGYVYGAVWDERFFCKIVEGSDFKSIDPMRCSKYVQSDTGDSFRQVKERLLEGRVVVYFGCPCQIAGLKSFIRNSNIDYSNMANLITVDLFCFFAPSNGMFRKYLDEEYGIETIASVNFRYKSSAEDITRYRIEFKNGKILYPERCEDPFLKAFHEALTRGDTCHECKLYEFPRQGDFSIGDFWGIEKHDLTWDASKGVSVVLVNNDKAADIMDKIRGDAHRCEKVPLEWCLDKGNRVGTEGRDSHPSRNHFKWLIQHKEFRDSANMAINKEHDVGCVCMFNLNIGNNLTNMALYRVLTDMGLSVLMISPPSDFGLVINGEKRDRFSKFMKMPYPEWSICDEYRDKWDYYELNDKCRMFVLGCDQLWRGCYLYSYDFFFCLDWVRSDRYKMSYSTSFGTDYYDGDDYCYKKESLLLKRINSISVRENSGKKLVKDLSGNNAEVVLDPVFMCNPDVYDKMADSGNERILEGKFVGTYLLDPTESKERILREFSEECYNGSYLAITDIYSNLRDECKIEFLHDPCVEEWLAMIRKSDFFITDSFHGICFSIIFKKQFCVIFDENNWRGYDRIRYILGLFNLADRKCNSYKDVKKVYAETIDYDAVYRIVEKKRDESYRFLIQSIQEGLHYNERLSDIDLFFERECNIGRQLNEVKNSLRKMRSKAFVESFYEKGIVMREIVGFGTGSCFRRNAQRLKEFSGLKYVCDNAPEKWGNVFFEDIVCISPKMLRDMEDPMVIILVDDICIAFDIAKQLIEMGIIHFTHVLNWEKELDC